MDKNDPLRDSTSTLLNQLKIMIDLLDDDDYKRPLSSCLNATIGQHVRHVLDMYDLIMVQVAQRQVIDYNARQRDIATEVDRYHALDKVDMIIEAVHKMNDGPVVTVGCFTTSTCGEQSFNSSIGRELMFAFDHLIHHMAIMRIGIENSDIPLALPNTFGVAPATLKIK